MVTVPSRDTTGYHRIPQDIARIQHSAAARHNISHGTQVRQVVKCFSMTTHGHTELFMANRVLYVDSKYNDIAEALSLTRTSSLRSSSRRIIRLSLSPKPHQSQGSMFGANEPQNSHFLWLPSARQGWGCYGVKSGIEDKGGSHSWRSQEAGRRRAKQHQESWLGLGSSKGSKQGKRHTLD